MSERGTSHLVAPALQPAPKGTMLSPWDLRDDPIIYFLVQNFKLVGTMMLRLSETFWETTQIFLVKSVYFFSSYQRVIRVAAVADTAVPLSGPGAYTPDKGMGRLRGRPRPAGCGAGYGMAYINQN